MDPCKFVDGANILVDLGFSLPPVLGFCCVYLYFLNINLEDQTFFEVCKKTRKRAFYGSTILHNFKEYF